jgi:hypothetical protein
MEAQSTIMNKFRRIAELVTDVLFDVLESRQKKNETTETNENNDTDTSTTDESIDD